MASGPSLVLGTAVFNALYQIFTRRVAAEDSAETSITYAAVVGTVAVLPEVDDVEAEYKRLTALGVAFTAGPTLAGDAVIAVFDDTCGNLIQIIAENPRATAT